MIQLLFASILSAHAILIPARPLPLLPKELARDHLLETGTLTYEDLARTQFYRAEFEKRGLRYFFEVDMKFPAVVIETEGRWPLVYVWLDDGQRVVDASEGKARVTIGDHVVLRTKAGRWRRLRESEGCERYLSRMYETETLRQFAAASHQDP